MNRSGAYCNQHPDCSWFTLPSRIEWAPFSWGFLHLEDECMPVTPVFMRGSVKVLKALLHLGQGTSKISSQRATSNMWRGIEGLKNEYINLNIKFNCSPWVTPIQSRIMHRSRTSINGQYLPSGNCWEAVLWQGSQLIQKELPKL